jgi:DNA topoisomerase-1
MESEGIGTKATRADTISTLLNRKYMRRSGDLIPEENALVLIHELRKHCPEIISPEMTRSLEKKLDALQRDKDNEELVMAEELVAIRSALRNMTKMDSIAWKQSGSETKTKNLSLGQCPNCKTGTLEAIRSFKTKKRFIRCTNYESGCKTSSPLPPRGIIKTTKNFCDVCGWPKILILSSRASSQSENCSNFACKSRNTSVKGV